MAIGISLHIGLNYIDPAYYGDEGRLSGCENDANDCLSIAKSKGFSATRFLNKEATRTRVLQFIKKASTLLTTGDIFLISYSGHGSYRPDQNGDEIDQQDETWCLYDGMLIDDELKAVWTRFKAGVRILILSDSCHSGTVEKGFLDQKDEGKKAISRSLPIKTLQHVLNNNQRLWTKVHSFSLRLKVAVSAKAD
jgi:hypothetical protein